MATIEISADLLDEAIESLERVGCQFGYCDGPTLDPVDMRTCYVCETLAKLRVAADQPQRRDDEMTFEERWTDWNNSYMDAATGGRYRRKG